MQWNGWNDNGVAMVAVYRKAIHLTTKPERKINRKKERIEKENEKKEEQFRMVYQASVFEKKKKNKKAYIKQTIK